MTRLTMSPKDHARIADGDPERGGKDRRRDLLRRCALQRQLFLSLRLLSSRWRSCWSAWSSPIAAEYWWLRSVLPVFVAAQILAIACALAGAVAAFRRSASILVPRRLRYRHAHDNAMKQFLARNVHITAARTGVLIFVSLAERYAEVVADSGINAKVRQDDWDGVVAGLIDACAARRLADGFVTAIGRSARCLPSIFRLRPATSTNSTTMSWKSDAAVPSCCPVAPSPALTALHSSESRGYG